MSKIAIDISPLIDGNKLRGVGYYTKHLVAALQIEIKTNPDYKDYEIKLITNKLEIGDDYDLIHYPYFTPFKLTLPFIKKKPTIISIHDVIERQFKKHYPVGIKGEIKWQIQKFLARQSDYIITVSHYSKYIIADQFQYQADHIYVTPEAADRNYHQKYSPEYLNKIKQKYSLPSKFVLNNGDINWNKNIPGLVKACQKLGYPLVIVGASATQTNVPKHPWTQDLTWLQQQKDPNIILTGFAPDEDLPGIYKLATIYCQASFAEGFGLAIVKAMQVGCPVVYSQETSLPEIMDFNGIMFNPYDQLSLETALKRLWTNSKLRHKFAVLGLKRSQIFNWQFTALQTLAVYQLALINAKK